MTNLEDLKNVYVNVFMDPKLYTSDYVLSPGAPSDKNISIVSFFESI